LSQGQTIQISVGSGEGSTAVPMHQPIYRADHDDLDARKRHLAKARKRLRELLSQEAYPYEGPCAPACRCLREVLGSA
jgi:hypothetical protein